MLTSTDFRGLLSRRFFDNFLPVPATSPLTVGAIAPQFELPEANHPRTVVRLSDYVGTNTQATQPAPRRPVLLYFTRIFTEKQYCPLCFPHLKELNEHYEQFTQQGAEVLMITSTDLRQSQTVAQDLHIKMPLLVDPTCRVFRRYRVGQALGAPLPAQFWVDGSGKIRFRHLFSFLEPNASVERLQVALARML